MTERNECKDCLSWVRTGNKPYGSCSNKKTAPRSTSRVWEYIGMDCSENHYCAHFEAALQLRCRSRIERR